MSVLEFRLGWKRVGWKNSFLLLQLLFRKEDVRPVIDREPLLPGGRG